MKHSKKPFDMPLFALTPERESRQDQIGEEPSCQSQHAKIKEKEPEPEKEASKRTSAIQNRYLSDRSREVYDCIKELGSHAKAAKKLGIQRDRVALHYKKCIEFGLPRIESSKKKASVDLIGASALEELAKKQKYLCALSGRPLTVENVSADHITPISMGGTNTIDNIQLVCRDINYMKGTMSMGEFVSACVDVAEFLGGRLRRDASEGEANSAEGVTSGSLKRGTKRG